MTESTSQKVLPRLAEELKITVRQVAAVAKLLDEGNTIPFIARYRKEVHENLDEVQISSIQERLGYYSELEERRASILKSIEEQGKLTDELRERIEACMQKNALEDLYAPYKPRRRTKADIAREDKKLGPLADAIWAGDKFDAATFVSAENGVATPEDALAGARDILTERIGFNSDARACVRDAFAKHALVKSSKAKPNDSTPTKFEQYYDFSESVATIPSHRYLAIRRGVREEVLFMHLELPDDRKALALDRVREIIAASDGFGADANPAAMAQVEQALADAFRRTLSTCAMLDVEDLKKDESDRAAVDVFAENLRHLLLASPLGEKRVLAIDPGIRTGCKVALLDATGKFIINCVIFPDRRTAEAQATIAAAIEKYKMEAVAVGNGTAGRETEAFVRDVLKQIGAKDVIVVSVSEAGASVYSASTVARDEFPDLDLTVRGAISIGRRLQDPLAELVKIDPKAIGVGQYQHDVSQTLLATKLDEVVVSCVNKVGVELNTASSHLLTRVSGIGPTLAKNIVAWRDENGAFKSRRDLLKVPKLGPKAYEQCAGFLRIRGAENPLDSSAVHPERYALVETIASDLGVKVGELVGNAALADKIDVRRYITNDVGEPTLKDIVAELKKPGRDPRAVFEKPAFREDVMKIEDVKEGMVLEGVVTNVTAFGAFVDIGVHQDGLVHVSEIADHYVSDPASVVKAGDKLKVRVLSVDVDRQRISLSARTQPRPPRSAGGQPRQGGGPRGVGQQRGGGSRSRDFSSGGDGFNCNPFANL